MPNKYPKALIEIFVIAFLMFQLAMGIFSQRTKSVCFDEPEHLRSGLRIWNRQGGVNSLVTLPLPQMIIAFPQILLDPNNSELRFDLARIPVLVTMLMLGWGLFVWVRARVGHEGALISLVMYCFSPNILAHGRIATADFITTAFFFVSLVSSIALIRQITWSHFIATGFSLGLLFTTKLTAFLILPPLVVLGVCRIIDPWPLRLFGWRMVRPWQKSLALIGIAWILGGSVAIAIWSIYGFQFMVGLHDSVSYLAQDGFVAPNDILGHVLRWLNTHKLLPTAYLAGIKEISAVTNVGYLRGETSYEGWWWYFPYALLVKTPIPTLLCVLLGLGLATVQLKRLLENPSTDVPPNLLEWMGLMLFIFCYLGVMMTSSYNIGVRHILPIYPCGMALASPIVRLFKARKKIRFIIVFLLLWLAFTFVRQSPDYLTYFNEFVGGSKNGYRHLVDSNLDWGQDLPRLSRYLAKQQNPEIWLEYFGVAAPSSYGIRFQPIIPSDEQSKMTEVLSSSLSGGLYVVSLTSLFGGYILDKPYDFNPWIALHRKVKLHHKALIEPESRRLYENIYGNPPTGEELITLRRFQGLALLRQLKQREPDDRIGYTMFVYQLSDEEVATLTAP